MKFGHEKLTFKGPQSFARRCGLMPDQALISWSAMRRGPSEIRKMFDQVVLPHLDTLFSAAFHLTGNKRQASDLCQEAMLHAYGSLPDMTAGTEIRVWLLTILCRAFRGGRWRDRREHEAALTQSLEESVEAHPLTFRHPPGSQQALLGDPAELHLQRLLRGLPEDYKMALLLVDIEQLTYQEAAKVLEVSIEAIRSRVSRGRALMRPVVEESGLRTQSTRDDSNRR